ncbi:MAG: hypothetical protein AB8H79_20235 [Myxococcota bacterium]
MRLSLLCAVALFCSLPSAAAAPDLQVRGAIDGPIQPRVDNARIAVNRGAQPAQVQMLPSRIAGYKGGSFVRFTQHVRGVEVEGGEWVVNLDPSGNVRRVANAKTVDPTLNIVPTIDADVAIAAAEAVVDTYFGRTEMWPSRSELRAWVDVEGQSHLVWAVDSSSSEPIGTYRVLVDAHTGEVVQLTPTLKHAKARVYPTNPQTSELTEVDLLRLDGDGSALTGPHGEVVSCTDWSAADNRCNAKEVLAVPDDAGDYFFEPNASSSDDPFAEVQMYYHLDKVGEYFAESHGFQHPRPIEAIVNFNYDNAFFGDADGDGIGEIAFGQNARADFGYDGDVVYHEFVHSVFDSVATAGLFGADEYGIDFAPGALNEGSADLFAFVLTGDPKLGEYAGRGFGLNGPVRDAEADLSCPNNLFGQSHEDGKIWGAMGWNMIEDDRVGPDVVGDLIYGVLEAFPATISWEIAGDTLVEVAGDMLDAGSIDSATHNAIIEHAEAAGVPGCKRIVPLDDGFSPRLLALGVTFGELEHVPLSSQFSIEAPEGTTEIRFNVDEWQVNQPNMAWTLFVRRGDFIEHELQSLGFFSLPVPTAFDFKVDGDDTGTVVIDADSDVPLEPGATYHFSIGIRGDGPIQGFGQGIISTSAEVTVVPVETVDPIPEEPRAACGCASGSGWGFGLALPLLALAVVRRRRS